MAIADSRGSELESAQRAELTKTSSIVASPNCVATELDGETVILDLNRGLYFGLNPVGSVIWAAIQSPALLERIYDAVLERYTDVEPKRVHRDVQALIEKMSQQGLVQLSNVPAA